MKERTSHSLFCMVAHFYQSITTLRTSNLIFQGRMGRVRCPWVPPGVTSARWGAETCIDPVLPGWRRGAGRSLHRPSPLLRWSTSPASCLPFLSFTQISPVPPSFKTSCSVLASLSVSFCPQEFVWKHRSCLPSALCGCFLQYLCKIGVSCFSEVKETWVC